MIKYVLPAAVAALALGAPAVVHAQMTQPLASPAMPNGEITNASVTITGQPQPGPYQPGYGRTVIVPGQPVPAYMPQPGFSPRTVWIPAHFEWDANTSNYVHIEGQYIEAPRENAQWIPGHWVQTPTSWIWLEGTWN